MCKETSEENIAANDAQNGQNNANADNANVDEIFNAKSNPGKQNPPKNKPPKKPKQKESFSIFDMIL